jgi:hypothetical protein
MSHISVLGQLLYKRSWRRLCCVLAVLLQQRVILQLPNTVPVIVPSGMATGAARWQCTCCCTPASAMHYLHMPIKLSFS